jgi:hypothetical protein
LLEVACARIVTLPLAQYSFKHNTKNIGVFGMKHAWLKKQEAGVKVIVIYAS